MLTILLRRKKPYIVVLELFHIMQCSKTWLSLEIYNKLKTIFNSSYNLYKQAIFKIGLTIAPLFCDK